MSKDAVPDWAQDATPDWVAKPSAAPAAPSAAALENQARGDAGAATAATNKEESLVILQDQFQKAQQAYSAALASGEADRIAREKANVEGAAREINRVQPGAAPDVNHTVPGRMATAAKTVGQNMPDNELAQRGAYGTLGAGAAMLTTGMPIAYFRAYQAAKKALESKNATAPETAPGTTQTAAAAEGTPPPEKAVFVSPPKQPSGEAKGSGMYRYILPNFGNPDLMPTDAQIARVTSTHGDNPTGAQALIKQTAAGWNTIGGMGIDPGLMTREGDISVPPTRESLRAQALKIAQDAAIKNEMAQQAAERQARINTMGRFQANIDTAPKPAPAGPSAYESALSAAKDYATRGGRTFANVAQHPLAVSGAVGFGVGAQAPEIAEHFRKNDYGGVAKDVATGAAYGTVPALLPAAVQRGLAVAGPIAASVGNVYDAGKRAIVDKDYTGAMISGAGGLAALAPFVASGPPGWALGTVGALGALSPAIINYFRDKEARERAGGGRGFVNPQENYVPTRPAPGRDPSRMAP